MLMLLTRMFVLLLCLSNCLTRYPALSWHPAKT